ncbi:5'-3' exonuclease H3TH domain-containing protein [Paraclostridium ghonii]|uniref:5'-3' exonuclease n=1 Tax=Paraclostridium ghonii TaxID=29358 RepID=UPI00202CB137|nr:5'-3' exonuclease H3TH domain-containing protein [Paeniclostridium ghonii]MCM0165573.1 5'-3' exonuclease [Paeniclostridium ghonii]
MDLFDLLEQKEAKEEKIKESELSRGDCIRLNSYVGSRLNTDFRMKNKKTNNIQEEISTTEETTNTEYNKIEKIEDVQINEITDKEKLLVIDGSSLLSTSYFARLPRQIMFAKTIEEKEQYYDKILQTKDGIYTNGVFGFMQIMLSMIREQKPTHLAVCLDSTRMTFRKLIYNDYKGTRKPIEVPLKEQYDLLRDMLEAIGVKVLISSPSKDYTNVFEADDFAGTLSKKFQSQIPVALYTKDEDYLQLVDYNTVVWMNTSKATDIAKACDINLKQCNLPNNTFEYTVDLLKKVKSLKPHQIVDYKAISGDSSDNIPGIKGLGDTTSIPLLQKYNTLEDIYKDIEALDEKGLKLKATDWKNELGIRNPMKKLVEQKDNAFMSKKLATIKTDIDIDLTVDDLKINIDKQVLREQLDKYEMKSIKL